MLCVPCLHRWQASREPWTAFKNEKAAQRVSFGAGYPADVTRRVFGEGVKSARGDTAILGRGRPHSKHVWNIPSHSLKKTNYCTRNSRNNAIALRPLRTMRRMNYCTNYCDGKQLLQRHPLRNPPLLRTPKRGYPGGHPGAKTSVKPSKPGKKQAFWRGRP